MKTAHLIRITTGVAESLGVLVLDDGTTLRTLEPAWRDNAANVSCIPAGEYEVVPHQSPRYGRVPLVTGVPDRKYILLHSGNVALHTKGCLLLGMSSGKLVVDNRRINAVLSSRFACSRLWAWMAGEEFLLSIES